MGVCVGGGGNYLAVPRVWGFCWTQSQNPHYFPGVGVVLWCIIALETILRQKVKNTKRAATKIMFKKVLKIKEDVKSVGRFQNHEAFSKNKCLSCYIIDYI